MIHFDVTKAAEGRHASGLQRVSRQLLAALGPAATPVRWDAGTGRFRTAALRWASKCSSTQARAAVRRRSAKASSRDRRSSQPTQSAGAVTSATIPETPWVTASVVAAAGEVSTTTPAAIASGITLGRPSRSPLAAITPVWRSASAQASWFQTSCWGRWPVKVTSAATPNWPASRSSSARRGPSPRIRAENGTPAAFSAA